MRDAGHGHRHRPLQLAEAARVLYHDAALLPDLVTGQAVGEVLDLLRAALRRRGGGGHGEGAGYDGDEENGGGELGGRRHG